MSPRARCAWDPSRPPATEAESSPSPTRGSLVERDVSCEILLRPDQFVDAFMGQSPCPHHLCHGVAHDAVSHWRVLSGIEQAAADPELELRDRLRPAQDLGRALARQVDRLGANPHHRARLSALRSYAVLPVGRAALRSDAERYDEPELLAFSAALPFYGHERAKFAMRVVVNDITVDVFGLTFLREVSRNECMTDSYEIGDIAWMLRGSVRTEADQALNLVKRFRRWWKPFTGQRVRGSPRSGAPRLYSRDRFLELLTEKSAEWPRGLYTSGIDMAKGLAMDKATFYVYLKDDPRARALWSQRPRERRK